uniref:Uncharacterized protein n=1 Tax=Anguilla anguilla TaxID=7936 RepID=A0A0E9WR23_ANGAN
MARVHGFLKVCQFSREVSKCATPCRRLASCDERHDSVSLKCSSVHFRSATSEPSARSHSNARPHRIYLCLPSAVYYRPNRCHNNAAKE